MHLGELHPSFIVLPHPPSRPPHASVAQLLEVFPFCPADYVSLVTELDGFSIQYVGQDCQRTISVMGIDDALKFPADYPFVAELGKSFFFATDGDLSYFYTVQEDQPSGVYRVETSAAFWSEVEFIAPTIRHVFADGVGIVGP